MNFEEFKDHLVMQIKNQACYRDQKAVEYPDDLRNAQSAEALHTLSQNLSHLSPEHPKLRATWRYWYGLTAPGEIDPLDDCLPFIDAEQYLLKRYGFNSPADGDPETFLGEYMNALQMASEK